MTTMNILQTIRNMFSNRDSRLIEMMEALNKVDDQLFEPTLRTIIKRWFDSTELECLEVTFGYKSIHATFYKHRKIVSTQNPQFLLQDQAFVNFEAIMTGYNRMIAERIGVKCYTFFTRKFDK